MKSQEIFNSLVDTHDSLRYGRAITAELNEIQQSINIDNIEILCEKFLSAKQKILKFTTPLDKDLQLKLKETEQLLLANNGSPYLNEHRI
jgi:hypothetical protein